MTKPETIKVLDMPSYSFLEWLKECNRTQISADKMKDYLNSHTDKRNAETLKRTTDRYADYFVLNVSDHEATKKITFLAEMAYDEAQRSVEIGEACNWFFMTARHTKISSIIYQLKQNEKDNECHDTENVKV